MILSLILPLLPTHSRKPFENELSTPKNLLQIPGGVLLSFQPSLAFARVRNKFCFLSFYCWIGSPSLLWTLHTFVSLPRLHVYRNLFPFVSWLVNIDYFIENATYGFLFTSCKTLENERVSFLKSCNEWIKIRTKHFLCCNLFIVYMTRIKQTHSISFSFFPTP